MPNNSSYMSKLVFAVPITYLILLTSCATRHPDETAATPNISRDLHFLTQRSEDLRFYLFAEQEVKDLIKQQMCLVVVAGKYNRSSVRIPIGTGLSLDKVMVQRFGHEYDGQVKVVSQNTIIQTSIIKYNPSDQLNIQVHPGDLVFINGRD